MRPPTCPNCGRKMERSGDVWLCPEYPTYHYPMPADEAEAIEAEYGLYQEADEQDDD